VKDVRYKARMIRVFIGLGLVVSLLVMLTGCWPFNTFPVAYFTASPLSGPAPLSVAFSAMLSEDPDGFILKWEWDFGDGESGVGESISHTYDTPGTYDVTLRVTDDDSATATAQRTITVTAAEEPGGAGAGPTASFTATPLVGAAPLTVSFNASASAYAGHAITYYSWDFGDGVTGTGMTTTHTYAPLVTSTYNVVLRIIAADNTEDTTTKSITATVIPPTPPSAGPTADFDATPTAAQIGPHTFQFDPEDSQGAAGHDITTYVWNFGDQSSHTETTDKVVEHTYATSQSTQNFTVTLTVIDDQPLTDSYSRTVTVKNLQPIAGFEMEKDGGAWDVEDIELYEVQTAAQTLGFRSVDPTGNAAEDYWDQNKADNNNNLPNDSTSTEPDNFEENGTYQDGDHNLSYDPEGNGSNDGHTWGIISYIWDFGDTTTETKPAAANGSCAEFTHDYQLGEDEDQKTFTVTLEVLDTQGARSSYSRTVRLDKNPE